MIGRNDICEPIYVEGHLLEVSLRYKTYTQKGLVLDTLDWHTYLLYNYGKCLGLLELGMSRLNRS